MIHVMSSREVVRIFGLADWLKWLDRTANTLYGMSGPEFERAYRGGTIEQTGTASDIGSVLPLIDALRRRSAS
jgi:hypothetical protein